MRRQARGQPAGRLVVASFGVPGCRRLSAIASIVQIGGTNENVPAVLFHNACRVALSERCKRPCDGGVSTPLSHRDGRALDQHHLQFFSCLPAWSWAFALVWSRTSVGIDPNTATDESQHQRIRHLSPMPKV